MNPALTLTGSQSVDRTAVPRLSPGDWLTSEEYLRRYEAMPEGSARFELIDNIVYPVEPSSFDHAAGQSHALKWLLDYAEATPGVACLTAPTLRMDSRNTPEPDAVLYVENPRLGRARITGHTGRRYLTGAPELILEVAATTSSRDLHQKKTTYHRAGVLEYIVHEMHVGALYWFQWRRGGYVTLAATDEGILCSRVFPGLWLAAQAFLSGERAQVARILRRGLRTPRHATFVRKLAVA